jgi:hypothetical protein
MPARLGLFVSAPCVSLNCSSCAVYSVVIASRHFRIDATCWTENAPVKDGSSSMCRASCFLYLTPAPAAQCGKALLDQGRGLWYVTLCRR